MKKHRRIRRAAELPEEIIHHIQSYMDERDAARTTLLSKSWYSAWSTRPILDFDESNIPTGAFPELMEKTMQRYEDLNLNINTLRLVMIKDHSLTLTTELILKSIKLRVVNLTLHFPRWAPLVSLPNEVLESKTLVRLSLKSVCVRMIRNNAVTCSNLKSLSLFHVYVNGDLFRDLISRCPLIEVLLLDRSYGSKRRLSGSHHRLWPKFPCLKELVIHVYGSVRICSASFERITLRDFSIVNASVEFDVPNIQKFKFVGVRFPKLSIEPTISREWELYIHIISREYQPSVSWISSLNQFAKTFSLSQVSLILCLHVTTGLGIPTLESLYLAGRVENPAFLDALFRSCCPNFINIQRSCVLGMEEVNAEEFRQLRSLPWKTLLDASRPLHEFVRFQL